VTTPHRQRCVALLLGVLCAQVGVAAAVTVNVATRAGSAAVDTVIVFDPLDATPAPSRDTASIDQINKRFVPRVSVVRTGTTVTFPNSDHIRHQVYSFSEPKQINLKLYAGSPKTPIVFDRPGLIVLGCNIHDSMVGFVGVVDSPYFGKTTESGTVALNLPAGRYRLRAWNPNAQAAVAAREITVGVAPLSIPLTIDLDNASANVAAWPE
jgi:plastocyanin